MVVRVPGKKADGGITEIDEADGGKLCD